MLRPQPFLNPLSPSKSALVNVRAGPYTYPFFTRPPAASNLPSRPWQRRTWWQVIQEQSGWIFDELVQTAGALDAVQMQSTFRRHRPQPLRKTQSVRAATLQSSSGAQAQYRRNPRGHVVRRSPVGNTRPSTW
ncbi:MAG: hypothetical protein R2911_00555 [Caldilineaceae bacterium]